MAADYHAVSSGPIHREARIFISMPERPRRTLSMRIIQPAICTTRRYYRQRTRSGRRMNLDGSPCSIADAGIILVTARPTPRSNWSSTLTIAAGPSPEPGLPLLRPLTIPWIRQLLDHARRYFRADHQDPSA